MLTYQLQKRVYRSKNHARLIFPNDVQIEICFEPTEQFGVTEKHQESRRLSKTIAKGSTPTVLIDANTGKQGVKYYDPPFKSIQQSAEFANLKMEMQGNKLHVTTKCQDFRSLDNLMIICHYILPILLNLEFAEPPTVKYTRGRVGETVFNWELGTMIGNFDVTTEENQEKHIADSFMRLRVISGTENRRLAAALYHFYVARRLVESGNSPYEFLAEYILNLDKVLRVLFGEKSDVRSELKKFGYSDEEIEERFMPIMILRNEFDVGHVSLRMFKQSQLEVLYRCLEMSELDFRDLLKRVFRKVENEEYTLQQDPDLTLKGDKLRIMEKLIATIKRRLSRPYGKSIS